MPMVLCQVNNYWNQHWEGLLLVSLKDVKEVVVLKEAHCSVRYLQMDTSDALYDSLEESWDEMLHLIDLTNFEDFLELGQEEGLLDAVGKWPILKKSFQQRDSQSSVFCQEQHGASEELLVELRASLHFVERDDNVLEENYMLISEGDSETTNDTGQDIKKLSGTIEFVVLVDKSEEALVHGLSNHLSSWNKLGIELVKNVLKIVSLDGLFGIEKLEELLNKLWGDVNLE